MLCVRDVFHPYLILNGDDEQENDGRARLLVRVNVVRVRVWHTSE